MKLRLCLLFIVACLFSCKKKAPPSITDPWELYRKAYGFFNSNSDSAFFYFNKVVTTVRDHQPVAMAYTGMSIIQSDAGDYFGAQESLVASLKIESGGAKRDSVSLCRIYNELGLLNYNMKNYNEAIDLYQRSIGFCIEGSLKPILINNLASVYQEQRKYGRAIRLYKTVIGRYNQAKDVQARLISNMAFTQWLKNPVYNAAPQLLKALNMWLHTKDELGQISVYNYLADYYALHRPDSGLFYAKKAYTAAIKLHNAYEQLAALKRIIKSSSADSSKVYFLRYDQLNDSVQIARSAARNQFALIRYNAEKGKADNLLLQKDNTDKKYQIARQQLLLSAAVLLFVLSGAAGLLWYQRREQRLKLEAQHAIREHQFKTSKKIHDVVANGLYRVMAEVQHQEQLNKEKLLDRIEVLYERSRDISYEPSPLQAGAAAQIGELITSFGSAATRVAVIGNNEVLWQHISLSIRHELEQILLELMVNMKKHSQADIVTIRFSKSKSSIEIKYKDNGIGLQKNTKFGNGLTSTENRIKMMNGKIIFDSRQGTHIQIWLPVA